MTGFGAERREARLAANYDGVPILSDAMYNLVLGGMVLYGLIVSMVLSVALMPSVEVLYELYPVIIIAYFVLGIAGVCMSGFSSNPVISFIGYNMLVVPIGVVLAVPLSQYVGAGFEIVIQALAFTAVITVCMIILSVLNPVFFLGLGGILLPILTGLVISGVVCLVLRWSIMWQGWIAVVLFSCYIGYDFQRSQQFEHTLDNAVDCALDIYLDIINLFLRILQILGNSKRRD